MSRGRGAVFTSIGSKMSSGIQQGFPEADKFPFVLSGLSGAFAFGLRKGPREHSGQDASKLLRDPLASLFQLKNQFNRGTRAVRAGRRRAGGSVIARHPAGRVALQRRTGPASP